MDGRGDVAGGRRARCLQQRARGQIAWEISPIGEWPHPRDRADDRRSASARAGIRLHRSATLTTKSRVRGVPVTSVARTIVDLSRPLKGRPLEALIDRADQRGLVDFEVLRCSQLRLALQAVLNALRAGPDSKRARGPIAQLCDDHWASSGPETNAWHRRLRGRLRLARGEADRRGGRATRTTARRRRSRRIAERRRAGDEGLARSCASRGGRSRIARRGSRRR